MQGPSASDAVKPEVRELSAYTLKHFAADVKLDQNENSFELPDSLKREIAERVIRRPWGRYPEFIPANMTKTLAKFTGWPEDGILVGNGSNELIQAALAVTLGLGRSIVIPQPTFTLYKLLSRVLQANVTEVLLNPEDMTFDTEQLASAASKADVVAICSPNNPTGTLLPKNDLAHILTNAKGLVLLDEAYHEFSNESALSLLPNHPNLVVLRTFSKAMSMAGLRFGYMMAHPEIAREVHKAKLPYNVNIFTLTAAEMVIENRSILDEAIKTIVQERQRVLNELKRRNRVRAFPSTANFILMKTDRPAREVFDGLYAQGVLVRDVSTYPLLDRAFRVSIGRQEENNRFLAALDTVLNA